MAHWRGTCDHGSLRPCSLFLPKLLLCMMLLAPWYASAMITVVESGKRYGSRQDNYYGPKFRKGAIYGARLQLLEGNLQLCPSSNNQTYNLWPPFDQLPVALLVGSGKCSLREKIDFVNNYVKPPGLVQFLIFDSGSYMLEGEDEGGDEDHDFGDEQFYPDAGEEDLQGLNLYAEDDSVLEEQVVGGRKSHRSARRDMSITQHILHVSARTQRKLIDLLVHQSDPSYMSGGIHITLDSRLGTSVIQQSTALWIAFSALMGACSCSFLLILSGTRNGWWDVQEPSTTPQPSRPQRRRLTKEQVRRLIPVYQFNGETLEALEERVPLKAQRGDIEKNSSGDGEGDDLLCTFVPRPLELTMCSICLDEYEPGDRIRCLEPCQHAFHAKCIGRWLSERSATCPLCKMEIHDPEEEEDEESEEDEQEQQQQQEQQQNGNQAAVENQNTHNNTDYRSRFFSAFYPRQTVLDSNEASPPALVDVHEGEETEQVNSPTPSATLELDDNASSVVEHHRRPWWRRMRRLFSSSNSSMNIENTTITLTQPLLGGEINNSHAHHHQGLSSDGNLMMPLESTISSQNNTLGSTTIVSDPMTTVTAAITSDEVALLGSNQNMGEDHGLDPPGQHANSREFAV